MWKEGVGVCHTLLLVKGNILLIIVSALAGELASLPAKAVNELRGRAGEVFSDTGSMGP